MQVGEQGRILDLNSIYRDFVYATDGADPCPTLSMQTACFLMILNIASPQSLY